MSSARSNSYLAGPGDDLCPPVGFRPVPSFSDRELEALAKACEMTDFCGSLTTPGYAAWSKLKNMGYGR